MGGGGRIYRNPAQKGSGRPLQAWNGIVELFLVGKGERNKMTKKTKKWAALTAAVVLGLGSMTSVQAAVTSVKGDGTTVAVSTGEDAVISAITVGSGDTLKDSTALVTGGYLYNYLQSSSLALAGGTASGTYAIAIGAKAEAIIDYAIAIGYGAKVDVNSGSIPQNGIAIGYNAQVLDGTHNNGSGGIAIGENALAIDTDATAIGQNVVAKYFAIAAGQRAYANEFSAAFGDCALAIERWSVAVGVDAFADGFGSTAMGPNAQTKGKYATAIGYHSIANTDQTTENGNLVNTVSFGYQKGDVAYHYSYNKDEDKMTIYESTMSGTLLSRLTNVAEGKADTDAVNYAQLKSYVAEHGGSGESGTSYTGSDTITIGTDNKISVTNMAMSTTGANLGATAGGEYSFAIGGSAVASGNQSVALGYQAVAGSTDSEETLEGATVAIGATANATGNGESVK